MKALIILITLFSTQSVLATSFGDSFMSIEKAVCSGAAGKIELDLTAQTLVGKITGNGRSFSLSLEPIKDEPGADYKVELIRNFLESGVDLLGGPVVSDDFESFGTYAIVLDKPLANQNSQSMTIVYVEAMSGWQTDAEMTCSFQ